MTRRMSGLLVIAFAAALLCLSLPAQAQKVAEGVNDFWVMNHEKSVVIDTKKGLYRLDEGKTKPILIYEGAHKGAQPLGETRLALEREAGGLIVLDVESGKARDLLEKEWTTLEHSYTSPGDDWCIFSASVYNGKPKQAVFRLDLKTLKYRKVISFDSGDPSQEISVFHDQSTMLVNRDDEEGNDNQTQHRIDLTTFKATARQVRPFDLADKGLIDCIPCPDRKTKVLIERGKLLAASAEKKDLGLTNAITEGVPNLEKSPTFLALYTRPDADPKFQVGEKLEIYLLDLKTLKFICLADARRPGPGAEPVGWSADGRYFFWTRDDIVGHDVPICLYAHDTKTGKTRRLTNAESSTGTLAIRDGYLPVEVADVIPAGNGQETSINRLCTIDMQAQNPTPVLLLEHAPHKWDVWGKMIVYADKEKDSPLALVRLSTREPPAKPHGATTTSAPAK